MPSFAPQSAHRAARIRHQQALENDQPEEITLGGVVLTVAGTLSPLRRPFADTGGGHQLVQTFTFTLRKALLTTSPTPNVTSFTLRGKTFTVREVSGDQPHLIAWRIVASRTARPGET